MENNKKVVIVDYNLGNMFSVYHACTALGYDAVITTEKKVVAQADYLILPGVGAFGDAISTLHKLDLVAPMKDFIASGKPFLGVCLGLQLLFSESEEFGSHKGLDIIQGSVKRFPAVDNNGVVVKIPQIEWNQIHCANKNSWQASPLHTVADADYMYFVHSFYVVPSGTDVVVSETEYGGIRYCSSVLQKNVFACQFHPEKSGEAGLSIYKNFLST